MNFVQHGNQHITSLSPHNSILQRYEIPRTCASESGNSFSSILLPQNLDNLLYSPALYRKRHLCYNIATLRPQADKKPWPPETSGQTPSGPTTSATTAGFPLNTPTRSRFSAPLWACLAWNSTYCSHTPLSPSNLPSSAAIPSQPQPPPPAASPDGQQKKEHL